MGDREKVVFLKIEKKKDDSYLCHEFSFASEQPIIEERKELITHDEDTSLEVKPLIKSPPKVIKPQNRKAGKIKKKISPKPSKRKRNLSEKAVDFFRKNNCNVEFKSNEFIKINDVTLYNASEIGNFLFTNKLTFISKGNYRKLKKIFAQMEIKNLSSLSPFARKILIH